MGSKFFKILYEFFFNFFDYFEKHNGSNEEGFLNYLEEINKSKLSCFYLNLDRKISKSKFSKNQNSYNEELQEEINSNHKFEKNSSTHSTLTNKLLKNAKIYQNEKLEKDFLMQKILNRKINRKMRKLKINKTVHNISTTDTMYT